MPDDIVANEHYAAARLDHRRRLRAVKRKRRIEVGPWIAFYFENRATMWHQVQEMLYIEKAGPERIAEELESYNPLVPEGRDLRCTMMIEIDDERRRRQALLRLGWVDEKAVLHVGARRIVAEPLQDAERNTAEGKTSSVHFLVFRLDDAAVADFRDPAVRVTLDIEHEAYGHGAVVSGETRAALAGDFD